MKMKSNRAKYLFKKFYGIVGAAFAFIVNTIGLAISIADLGNAQTDVEKNIFLILVVAEIFLVSAVIYSVVIVIRGFNIKESIATKDAELQRCKDVNKIVFENQKNIITYYKDFIDRLGITVSNYHSKLQKLEELDEHIDKAEPDNIEEIEASLTSNLEITLSDFKNSLIEQYNRFMMKTLDVLKESVEEYLSTKGCYTSVSIALKQLEESVNYKDIDEHKENIYTAFRDSRTYYSKKRNETWEKCFDIGKNSDFVVSIKKDYYIFNFMDKDYVDDGLYLNENSNFYEYYNSGVTCSIYSCVHGEKVLFGFLACDSLLDPDYKDKYGKNIYDYNVANILMSAAHIIALYLGKFLQVWRTYYIEDSYSLYENKKYESIEDAIKKENLCAVMKNSFQNARYKR